MTWKQKAIKYCMKCQFNDRLYCKRYFDWQHKNTIKKCEFIKAEEK